MIQTYVYVLSQLFGGLGGWILSPLSTPVPFPSFFLPFLLFLSIPFESRISWIQLRDLRERF